MEDAERLVEFLREELPATPERPAAYEEAARTG